MSEQVLDGVRVLDFSQGMAGPLATMILADYGAEVVRVEPPCGDPWWSHPAYLLWNRGKKSIELQWDSPFASDQMKCLIKEADVLVESLRPGEADRLGLAYRTAIGLNPALVYMSVSGFGQNGPYKNLRSYDAIVNAKIGRLREIFGYRRSIPIFWASNDASYHAAMFAVQGILAGLRVAWITGEGQRVATSLLGGATIGPHVWRRFDGEELPADPPLTEVEARDESDPAFANPSHLRAQCKDERWIVHGLTQSGLFEAWIKTIGFDWIWDDERFQGAPQSFANETDRAELNHLILARLREKTSAEWMELYRENPDCAAEVMQTTQEALVHPQFVESGHQAVIEDPRVGQIVQVGPLVTMSQTPAAIGRPAPMPGQDTARVLATGGRARSVVTLAGLKPKRPLDGVMMLELASWFAAPLAGGLLADLGARVVKIETLKGDPFRSILYDQFVRATQGKECIAVDLRRAEGQEVLHKLVAKTDVLVHNFRLGVPNRLGMDYPTLRDIKPDLVYIYAGAYGSAGPDARRAAFNQTIGAFAGSSVFQAGDGNIPQVDHITIDPLASSAVATAVMLGLAASWRTGIGQYLETTMINSAVYANSDDALSYVGKPPRRNPDSSQLGLEATYRLYETLDGWVFLACPTDEEFAAFCAAVGQDGLSDDPRYSSWPARYEHRRDLATVLESLFRTQGAKEWEARLTAADVGCVQADGMGYRRFLYEDPHARAVGLMVPTEHPDFSSQAPYGRYWRHRPVVEFSSTPCEVGKTFAAWGEHTRRVLEELGYGSAQIDQLKHDGIIGEWSDPGHRSSAVGGLE